MREILDYLVWYTNPTFPKKEKAIIIQPSGIITTFGREKGSTSFSSRFDQYPENSQLRRITSELVLNRGIRTSYSASLNIPEGVALTQELTTIDTEQGQRSFTRYDIGGSKGIFDFTAQYSENGELEAVCVLVKSRSGADNDQRIKQMSFPEKLNETHSLYYTYKNDPDLPADLFMNDYIEDANLLKSKYPKQADLVPQAYTVITNVISRLSRTKFGPQLTQLLQDQFFIGQLGKTVLEDFLEGQVDLNKIISLPTTQDKALLETLFDSLDFIANSYITSLAQYRRGSGWLDLRFAFQNREPVGYQTRDGNQYEYNPEIPNQYASGEEIRSDEYILSADSTGLQVIQSGQKIVFQAPAVINIAASEKIIAHDGPTGWEGIFELNQARITVEDIHS